MGDRRVTYEEALAALAERGRFGIRLGLGRTRALLRELGDPQPLDPRRARGGHERQGQRARARGQRPAGGRAADRRDPEAAPRDLPRADRARRPTRSTRRRSPGSSNGCSRPPTGSRGGSANPTEFELLTAVVFLAFAESDLDLALVEVGLGGRLDATHAWDGGVAVVTNVDARPHGPAGTDDPAHRPREGRDHRTRRPGGDRGRRGRRSGSCAAGPAAWGCRSPR